MAALTVFLYVLVVLIAVLLIGLILIQPAKSGGMGAAFGGIGESVFGAKAGSHLTKATVVMASAFFIIALTLAALIGHGVRMDVNSDTKVDEILEGSNHKDSKLSQNDAKSAKAETKAVKQETKVLSKVAQSDAKAAKSSAKAEAPKAKNEAQSTSGNVKK